jgi:hypothetical protein
MRRNKFAKAIGSLHLQKLFSKTPYKKIDRLRKSPCHPKATGQT